MPSPLDQPCAHPHQVQPAENTHPQTQPRKGLQNGCPADQRQDGQQANAREVEYRYTTVELLVETVQVRPRTDRIVGLQIQFGEKSLQAMVRAVGGTWDHRAKVWRLPRRVVGLLKLTDRITEK